MSIKEFATSVTTMFHVTDDTYRMTPDHSRDPGHFIRPQAIEITIETTTGRTNILITGPRYTRATGEVTQDVGFTHFTFDDYADVEASRAPDVAKDAVNTVVDRHIVKAQA